MKIKQYLAISFLLCCAFNTNALTNNNGTIYGAFGITFGSKKTEINIINEKSTYKGKRIYEVKVPQPMPDILQNYYVLLTPYSGKVYSIWAESTFGEKYKSKCEERKNRIISFLEKKYDKKFEPFKDPKYPNYNTNTEYISINESGISIACMDDGKVLSLRYINTELAAYGRSESQY